MRALQRLSRIGALLVALCAPAAASAAVVRVSSLPAGARAARAYVVQAVVVNDRGLAERATITAHLLRVGSHPLAIGRARVQLRAHAASRVGIRIHLPRLRTGSYALVACMPSGGGGAL